MLPSALFCSLCFFIILLYNCERKKEEKRQQSKFVFFLLSFGGILLCQVQRKTDLNGKDLNRLTEKKTGEDINRNKLEKEKEERRSQDERKGRIIEEWSDGRTWGEQLKIPSNRFKLHQTHRVWVWFRSVHTKRPFFFSLCLSLRISIKNGTFFNELCKYLQQKHKHRKIKRSRRSVPCRGPDVRRVCEMQLRTDPFSF